MPHPLEIEYGLSAEELLDAVSRRFRAKVALEGTVAEVQAERHILAAQYRGVVSEHKTHDIDGYADFSIWLPKQPNPFRIEVKNVRNSNEAYRRRGVITGYKVEVQKTRAAQGDATSRLYDAEQFEILAVCMGKKTHDWKQFMWVAARHLARNLASPHKLAVMHRAPLTEEGFIEPWYRSLVDLIETL